MPCFKQYAPLSTYFSAHHFNPARSSFVNLRTTFAGEPRTSEPGGIFVPCVTSAFAPMKRLFADDRAVQNHRAHADERFVADGAGVDDRAVADGDPVADEARKIVREMQHGVVLDVRVVADDDAVDVAAQHRAIPHARMRAERHVADDGGGLGDENIFAERRFFAEKSVKLLCQFVHAKNLTRSDRRHKLKEMRRVSIWSHG